MKNTANPLLILASFFGATAGFSQVNQPYTASFVGRMGVDTVLVETYTMINNHLYGKAFVRVPEILVLIIKHLQSI